MDTDTYSNKIHTHTGTEIEGERESACASERETELDGETMQSFNEFWFKFLARSWVEGSDTRGGANVEEPFEPFPVKCIRNE